MVVRHSVYVPRSLINQETTDSSVVGVTVGIIAIILAYLYRYKFIKKKARKAPQKGPNVTEHRESQKYQPQNRPRQLIYESRAFKVWGKVQQLRTKKVQVERSYL